MVKKKNVIALGTCKVDFVKGFCFHLYPFISSIVIEVHGAFIYTFLHLLVYIMDSILKRFVVLFLTF